MGPLSSLSELHSLTGGWSTLAVIAVAMSALLVGRVVMLGNVRGSWVSEHPIAIGIGASALSLVLTALFALAGRALLGLTWPALPLALLVTAVLVLALDRTGDRQGKR